MIEKQRVLAVVPARSGSKGLPGKNLRQLGDRPLVAWSVPEAKKSRYIDKLVLSSDSDEILDVGRAYGFDEVIKRPSELATDTARAEDVLIHALEAQDEHFGYILMLHSTVPLRQAEDIDGSIELCHRAGAPACVAVAEPAKSPYWMFQRAEKDCLEPLFGWENLRKRRQDLPSAYIPTGAVFVATTEWFCKTRDFYCDRTVGYVMPNSRAIDIDAETDFQLVAWILAHEEDGDG